MDERTLLQLNLVLLYVAGAFLLAAWLAERGASWEYDHLRFSEMLVCIIWPIFLIAFLIGLMGAALRKWIGGCR